MKPRTVKNRLNAKQRLIVIAMDVLLLIELVGSMRYASFTPETMTEIFLKLYVPMLVVTVVVARVAMRLTRDAQSETDIAVEGASCDNA